MVAPLFFLPPFLLGVAFDDETRKRGLLNVLSLVGIIFLVFLGSLAYLQGGVLLASIDLSIASLLTGLLYLLRQKRCLNLCIYGSVGLVFCLFLYLFSTGGVAGNAFLWSYTFPLIVFLLLGTKKGVLVLSLYYVSCLTVLLLDLNTNLAISLYSQDFTLRFLVSFAVVSIFTFVYELFWENSQRVLLNLNDLLEQEVVNRTAIIQEEVTKKTKAQKEATIAKEEWERTFDAVPDQIVILDTNYRVVRANKAMAEASKIPQSEFVGLKCHQIVHGTRAPPLYCPHEKFHSNHNSHEHEYYDGHNQRNFSVTISPFYDDYGKFLGAVRVARDITEHKKAQTERNMVREQLRKAEKMEAIGLMAGGVAHDLNNILSGVVSYPEILLHQLSSEDEIYEHIKFIHDSGKRAAAVVDDLLTVARGVATVREVSCLNDLITSYLESIEFKNLLSLHPDVVVDLNLEAKSCYINCSPVHIQKMLMNLITNGIEAINSKGSVQVSTENRTFDQDSIVTAVDAGKYVVLTVHDTGIGIAKHDLEKIFEPFYTKKAMGRSGTGLGLAVVWNIVTDHNATVNVSSDSKGTAFTTYFPATLKEKPVPAKDNDIADLIGKGNVLIVDDEKDQCRIASQMLESLGYSTKSVSSGEESVEFLKNNSVDLVILDMIMGTGINGRQTYEEIIKICPTQKAVIVSGFSESDDVKASLKLGAGGYIKKPYSMVQLGMLVQSELLKK